MVSIKLVLAAVAATLSATPVTATFFGGGGEGDARLWATSFIGCVSPEGLRAGRPTPVGTAGSHQQCISLCNQKIKWRSQVPTSYFGSDGSCYCGKGVGPDGRTIIRGGPGACPPGSYEWLDNGSRRKFMGCLDNSCPNDFSLYRPLGQKCLGPSGGQSFETGMDGTKFIGRPVAAVYSGTGTYFWSMSPPSGLIQTCDAASTWFYDSEGPTPSGFARRSMVDAQKRAEEIVLAAHPDCPVGYTSCQVSPNPEDGYECLDTNTELESCGGCRYGAYGYGNSTASGVDCTSLPKVRRGAVTCNRGQCQASLCVGGAKLISGKCVSIRA